MARLKGKTALITGAAGGIGQATADRFLKEGANLVVTDLDSALLGETILGDQDRVLPLDHDVTNENQWEVVIDRAVAAFGRLDIVVNNAGCPPSALALEDMPLETWRRVLSVNLDGVFLGVKHGIRAMKQSGGGSIVNLSSIMGLVALPHQVEYGASKGGVTLLTKGAALECQELGYNIRVNSIHPGFVDTQMVRDAVNARVPDPDPAETVTEKMIGGLAAQQPAGRLATPLEIANAILFVASDEASYVNGAQFAVDGGYTAR